MKIREYVKAHSVEALADASGLSRSMIYQLARGDKNPSLATMRAIQDATGGAVSVVDWFDERAESA